MVDIRVGRRRWLIAVIAVITAATVLSSCSGGGSGKQAPLSGKQTIVFAVQGGVSGGLGSEGANTAKEITAFEAKYPNITVKVQPTSGDSADQAEAQIRPLLASGNSTPDIIDADMTWVGPYAKAGWITPLDAIGGPVDASLFPGQAAAEKYQGKTYARPWFINVEGLYYRTDLVPTAPRSPTDVVSAAQAALKAHPELRNGFAWEGSKYEGQLTAFMTLVGGFGGAFDVKNLDSPQVLDALQYLHDLVYKYKITPQAVTGWTEQDADNAFTNGQAPFALNWPYQLQEDEADASKVKGKTAWIPFPSVTGHPIAPVGGSALMINARSTHKQAADEFIKFLLQCPQQLSRALDAGDPPSVRACYTADLYAKAPYFEQEKTVFAAALGRPVLANYKAQAAAIELMISQVLSNQKDPAGALKQAASTLASLQSSA
jgi:multiple sugar transport system substrate-binding protein